MQSRSESTQTNQNTGDNSMITKQQIEEIALNQALAVVFCNAGEEYWPDDPIDFLDQCADSDDFEIGDREMIPWEPFEGWNAGLLYHEVRNFQDTFIRAINEALAIERG